MKVAVIGSGLAGLTTAYLLRQEGIEVWLIEKSSKLGFHSQSVEIPLSSTEDGQRSGSRSDGKEKDTDEKWIVDVPMRAFQGGYYPLLLALYNHLGIPLNTVRYKYSFSSATSTYFIHSGSSGYAMPSLTSRSLSNLFTLIRDFSTFIGVALCYMIVVFLAFMGYHDLLPSCVNDNELTLKQFTSIMSSFLSYPFTIPIINHTPWTPLGDVFEFFIGKIVLPIFSAVSTMTTSDVWSLPVRIILEYIHLTFGTDHYHLADGHTAADIARILVEPVEKQGQGHLRLSTEISGLEYITIDGEGKVRIRIKDQIDSGVAAGVGESEQIIVDKVVLATPASVAKSLLIGLEDSLRAARQEEERIRVSNMRFVLNKVSYRETIVVTHRDTSILPPRKDRRDLNFLLPVPSPSSSQLLPSTHQSPEYPVPYFTPTRDRVYTQATQIILPPKHLRKKGRRDMVVLQTTNPCVPIDPRKVFSISRLERAIPLKQPIKTLSNLRSSSKNTPVYIVGSYAYPGIPLLEGCVGSAKIAVESIIKSTINQDLGRYESGKPKDPPEPRKDIGHLDWTTGRGNRRLGRVWRWRWCGTGWS